MRNPTESSSKKIGINTVITDEDEDHAPSPAVNHTSLIITLILGSILFLAAGFTVSILLGMHLFDRVDFLLSLSVVDILGCTFYAAWKTRLE